MRLLPIIHLQVVELVLVPQLAFNQALAGVILTRLAGLFKTVRYAYGFLSPITALLSTIAFASRPSVRVKSKPSIYLPLLFHELPVIEILVKLVKPAGLYTIAV